MVIPSSRDKLETLNELTQLRDSGFGQRHPRHGLRLLHWLARDCFSVDSTLLCDPRGDYGFHYFKNSEDNLPVPREDHRYYEVGNLNRTNAWDLPLYVTENYQCNVAVSNSDRLILSVGPGNIIDRIYATKHQGKGNFDSEHTYRISKGLMMIIERLELSEFLSEVEGDPATPANIPPAVAIEMESTKPTSEYKLEFLSQLEGDPATPANIPPAVAIEMEFTKPTPDHKSPSPPHRNKGFWDYCTIL